MAFSPEQVHELQAPLSRDHIRQREQSGRRLSYIEGWLAIAEANRIFGFDGWTRETVECRMVAEKPRQIGKPPNQREGWGVSYVCRVKVTVGAIVREGVGAGHGIDADLGLAHESAIKEAETDAMKRALMTFGNPFGLALYDKAQEGVEKPAGRGAPNGNTTTAPTTSQRAVAARRAPSQSIPDDSRFMSGDPASVRKRMIEAVKAQTLLPALNKLTTQPSWLEQLERLPEEDKTVVDLAIDDRRAELSNLLPAG